MKNNDIATLNQNATALELQPKPETSILNNNPPKSSRLQNFRLQLGKMEIPKVSHHEQDSYVKLAKDGSIFVGSFDAFQKNQEQEGTYICILPINKKIAKWENCYNSKNQAETIETEHFTKVDGKYIFSNHIPDSGYDCENFAQKEQPSVQKFIDFVKNTLLKIDLTNNIYINCQAGISRSVLFASCLSCFVDGVKNKKQITEQDLLNSIKDVKQERYTGGAYNGKKILESFAGEVKSTNSLKVGEDLDNSRLTKNFAGGVKQVIESNRLIKVAENNKFNFTTNLVKVINEELKNQLGDKIEKSTNNGLTI